MALRRTLEDALCSADMPPITALLHTANDAPRVGRALETLLPCAEILIVDHHSTDATLRIARAYGARVLPAQPQASANLYLSKALHDWILCLQPSESLTEGLQATLFEWSLLPRATVAACSAFSVVIHEQLGRNWRDLPEPEVRLVPRDCTLWKGNLPARQPSASTLEGELLRISYP